MKIPGGARKRARTRLVLLAAGEAVDVPAQFRRTSSRGWSPWFPGQLRLPAAGAATFVADDPYATGLVAGRGGRSGPIPLDGPAIVDTRRLRFKGETFFGAEARIIVVSHDRHTSEVAVAAGEEDAVVARLAASGLRPVDDPVDSASD